MNQPTQFKKKRRKTGGREKGTPNKTTKEVKEAISNFVNGNFNAFVDMLNEIENPAEKARLFIKLLEYVVPKQQQIDLDGNLNIEAVKVEFKQTGRQPRHEENEFLDD